MYFHRKQLLFLLVFQLTFPFLCILFYLFSFLTTVPWFVQSDAGLSLPSLASVGGFGGKIGIGTGFPQVLLFSSVRSVPPTLLIGILFTHSRQCGPGSSVGIATDYGLDGPGIESS
jgi:hypothetical protein